MTNNFAFEIVLYIGFSNTVFSVHRNQFELYASWIFVYLNGLRNLYWFIECPLKTIQQRITMRKVAHANHALIIKKRKYLKTTFKVYSICSSKLRYLPYSTWYKIHHWKENVCKTDCPLVILLEKFFYIQKNLSTYHTSALVMSW